MPDEDDSISRDSESRARTHLANERTYLAWFRTGVTLIALGLAAAQFLARDIIPGVPLTRGISIALVASGTFVALAGARNYFRGRRQIDAGSFEPARHSITVTSILVVLIGIMAVVFILLLRR